jgi:hypothetical protein
VLIPLYGFVQGDVLGLLLLVQDEDSIRFRRRPA